VDVVLVPAFPPLVRVPDLSIVALDLADSEPANYAGEQVRVAVEIISPGSRRTDRIMKMADYGEAGIPDYWIIDLDDPVSLDAFRLVDGGYQPVLRGATGLVELAAPVPLVIDLAALVARR
jgi:Uma2 family endonuclease